jgi:hypothetical protein
LFHDWWAIKEITEEIKKFTDLMKMQAQPIRTYGTQHSSAKKKVYSQKCKKKKYTLKT